jgi:KaiC/GvpD/RAD55 family RecA-like ATPase
MYDLGPAFQSASVDPGTNLLVSGPPLSGVRRLAFEAATHGTTGDDAVLVITTRYSARRVLADLETLVDTDSTTVGVVDCVTRRQNQAYTGDRRVKYVPSPAALTRIGMKFSEFVKEFEASGVGQTRVVLDSLSTLLPYAKTQSAFKFVHVLAGQIGDDGALGIHVVEPAAHDEERLRTLEELFDGRATVENDAVAGIDLD